jgi:uncharacterized protein YdaU (DUF1376 family)
MSERKFLPYFPCHTADIRRDTEFMEPEAAWAYMLLVFAFWDHGCLPDDRNILMRVTRLDARSNARTLDNALACFEQHKPRWLKLRREQERRYAVALAASEKGVEVRRRAKAIPLTDRFRVP